MKHIFLTGSPGVGKTTIIKNVCTNLAESKKISGFYTEEVRVNNQRTGFDIVTFSGSRGPLARLTNTKSPHMVGNYNVDVAGFEKLALPTINDNTEILVIDEIGKMELFSSKFRTNIENRLNSDKNVLILGTVPLRSNNALVNKIKHSNDVMLIEVNFNNRNEICKKIIELINK